MTQEQRTASEIWQRAAQPNDYPFALRLYLDGTRVHLEKLGRWNEEQTIARFKGGFDPSQAWVVCAGDKEIGWMQVSESPERLHLQQLHLLGSFHRRGIGSRLLRKLLERAARASKPVVLNVIIGNPARFLYERLGFRVTGTNEELVHMVWDLNVGSSGQPPL